jgi:hypothetical protein
MASDDHPYYSTYASASTRNDAYVSPYLFPFPVVGVSGDR